MSKHSPSHTTSSQTADEGTATVSSHRGALHVVHVETTRIDSRANDDSVALESALLDFDADADVAALVVMPPSIPTPLRRALTRAFESTFATYETLDSWLHEANPNLDGSTPFERLIDGAGFAVLKALSIAGDSVTGY